MNLNRFFQFDRIFPNNFKKKKDTIFAYQTRSFLCIQVFLYTLTYYIDHSMFIFIDVLTNNLLVNPYEFDLTSLYYIYKL